MCVIDDECNDKAFRRLRRVSVKTEDAGSKAFYQLGHRADSLPAGYPIYCSRSMQMLVPLAPTANSCISAVQPKQRKPSPFWTREYNSLLVIFTGPSHIRYPRQQRSSILHFTGRLAFPTCWVKTEGCGETRMQHVRGAYLAFAVYF